MNSNIFVSEFKKKTELHGRERVTGMGEWYMAV